MKSEPDRGESNWAQTLTTITHGLLVLWLLFLVSYIVYLNLGW